MRVATIVLLLSTLLLLANSMDVESARRFLQSTVRTATVAKMCASYPTKASLVD
jgi:hypothetical protein